MNRILFRLILEYVQNQGEINKETLERIQEEISEMKRKDKKRLEIYMVAIALLPDVDTEILRECVDVLLALKKRKMILKIINHRALMEYDRNIERIKGILDETIRQISNPKRTKKEIFYFKTIFLYIYSNQTSFLVRQHSCISPYQKLFFLPKPCHGLQLCST